MIAFDYFIIILEFKKNVKIFFLKTIAIVKYVCYYNSQNSSASERRDYEKVLYFFWNCFSKCDAILYGKQQGVQKSFLVNVRTGEMIKVYEGTVYGTCIENKLYSCDENNIFKVYNLNTGEYEKYIDVSSIKKEYGTGKRYIGYSQSLPGFFELYNFDIPGIEAYNASVKFDIYKGTLYFSYFSGVYRYNEKENKLEKILDGEKMLLYKEMYGSFTVGKEEQIYMLGFQGGGDDEGATDFLYLRKKG